MILKEYESEYMKGSLIVKDLHNVKAMSESFGAFSRHPSNLKIGMFVYCDRLGIDLYNRVQTNMILGGKNQIEIEDFLTNRYLNRTPKVMYAAQCRLFGHGRKRFEILNTVRVRPIENFSIEIELKDNMRGLIGEYGVLSVSIKYGELLFPIFWHMVMKTENLFSKDEGDRIHYRVVEAEEFIFDIGRKNIPCTTMKKSDLSDKIRKIFSNYLEKDFKLIRERKPFFKSEGTRIIFDSDKTIKIMDEAIGFINELITELEELCASLNLPIEVRYTT